MWEFFNCHRFSNETVSDMHCNRENCLRIDLKTLWWLQYSVRFVNFNIPSETTMAWMKQSIPIETCFSLLYVYFSTRQKVLCFFLLNSFIEWMKDPTLKNLKQDSLLFISFLYVCSLFDSVNIFLFFSEWNLFFSDRLKVVMMLFFK
jgi:hypothetical protein